MFLIIEMISKCQKLYKFFASNHEFVMIWYVSIIVYFTKDYTKHFFTWKFLSITHFLLCSSVIIGSIDLRKLVSRWIFVEFWLCDIQDRTNLVILSSFLIDLMWSLRCKKITDDHSLSEKFLLRQNTRIWYMLRVLKSKFL